MVKVASKEFVVIADDIPSLKALHDKFDVIRTDKGNRRQAEKELEQSLDALYVELKKREANFMKSSLKSRIKIMLECKEWEEAVKSGDCFDLIAFVNKFFLLVVDAGLVSVFCYFQIFCSFCIAAI